MKSKSDLNTKVKHFECVVTIMHQRNPLTFKSQAIILAFNINELLFVLFKIEMFGLVHIKFNLNINTKKINRLNYDF